MILYTFYLNIITCFLQMMLATCILLVAAKMELTADNATYFAAKNAELFKNGVVTPAASNACTSAGVFVIGCNSYLVCAAVGSFVGAQGTCPRKQNFDPINFQCSSSYVCPSCTTAGFICLSSTRFTLCAGPGVEIATNQACPSGYYCNEKCADPCLNDITLC
jgi:hypothetical protein